MITVDEKNMIWHEGMTIKDLLEKLDNVQFCAAIRLNGKLVSSPAFDTTLIPDHAVVYILPLIAGG